GGGAEGEPGGHDEAAPRAAAQEHPQPDPEEAAHAWVLDRAPAFDHDRRRGCARVSMERQGRARSERATSYLTGLVCMRCGRRYRSGLDGPCPRCGPEGVLDIEFDAAAARRVLNRRSLKARPHDIWRYRELLPVPRGARVP